MQKKKHLSNPARFELLKRKAHVISWRHMHLPGPSNRLLKVDIVLL